MADELTSYELGARATFLEGRLHVRTALFRAEWKNIQTDRLLQNGLPFTANIGDGGNTGFELEASFRNEGLTLEGDLFLNDPELLRPDPGFPIPRDRHLPGVASVLVNVAGRYEWSLSDGYTAEVGLEAGYLGTSILTLDAAITPQMGGYVTSRFNLGYGGDAWRVSIFAENLLGSDGDTFAYGNPFRLRQTEEQTPQQPRSVGLKLTRTFYSG